jgi:hypothetical protein
MKAVLDEDPPRYAWMDAMPLCTRSDSCGTSPSDRVRDTIMFAAGMAFQRTDVSPDIMLDRVKELIDHKGALQVVLWKPISPSIELCIRRAWSEVGHETEDSVELYIQGSEEAERMGL